MTPHNYHLLHHISIWGFWVVCMHTTARWELQFWAQSTSLIVVEKHIPLQMFILVALLGEDLVTSGCMKGCLCTLRFCGKFRPILGNIPSPVSVMTKSIGSHLQLKLLLKHLGDSLEGEHMHTTEP